MCMKKYYLSILILFLFSCSKPLFKESWLEEKAPAHFTVSFETSKGNFEAEFTREWSPLAVDRVYAQIRHGYYDHILFYRVRPKYVVQFGGNDTMRLRLWTKIKVPDEPVIKGNERGVISFARGGKDSRDNSLFINLQNNSPRLDTIFTNGVKGFPGFGVVTKNMEVVDAFYSGYGDNVFQDYDLLFKNKASFLQKYPLVDSLKTVKIIRKSNR